MHPPSDEYTQDFYDLLGGMHELIRMRHERIYREIEQRVIDAYKEVQRIQGQIVVEIARQLPKRLDDIS